MSKIEYYPNIGIYHSPTHSFIYNNEARLDNWGKPYPLLLIFLKISPTKDTYQIASDNKEYYDLECLGKYFDTIQDAFNAVDNEFKVRRRKIKISNILNDMS